MRQQSIRYQQPNIYTYTCMIYDKTSTNIIDSQNEELSITLSKGVASQTTGTLDVHIWLRTT